jgi:hypothetical protein
MTLWHWVNPTLKFALAHLASFAHRILWFQRILIQGNLKDVSKEFLGNHQTPTTVKVYIHRNFQGVYVLGFRVDDADDEEEENHDDVAKFNTQVAKLCVAR